MREKNARNVSLGAGLAPWGLRLGYYTEAPQKNGAVETQERDHSVRFQCYVKSGWG